MNYGGFKDGPNNLNLKESLPWKEMLSMYMLHARTSSAALSLSLLSLKLSLTLSSLFNRWVNVKDYFNPQDRFAKNHDVNSEVLGIAFDHDSKTLAASKWPQLLQPTQNYIKVTNPCMISAVRLLGWSNPLLPWLDGPLPEPVQRCLARDGPLTDWLHQIQTQFPPKPQHR